jgi:hypothetical protein
MTIHKARALACIGLLAGLAATAPAQAGNVDVGVSIGISQPGVYGRIDIGRYPQPQLIVQQPVVIVRQAAPPPPMYLWVPPGHQKNWKHHCGAYNACGAPVYFVQERWYNDHVMHDYRESPQGERHDNGKGHGNGNGNGKGHGKGKGD